MLDISKPHLVLLVSAVNDAIKYNEAFLTARRSRTCLTTRSTCWA